MGCLIGRCFGCGSSPDGSKQRQLTLLLVGINNAGKTTALNSLKGDLHSDTVPTYGFMAAYIAAANCNFKLYDLGGGRSIRRIWSIYVSEVHGIIYVVDAADPESFPEARTALHQLLEMPQLTAKPVLVFANKQDLPGAQPITAVATALGLDTQMQQHNPCNILPCTAKNTAMQQLPDPTLQQGLQWLLGTISPMYVQLQAKIDKETAEAKAAEEQRKRVREERVKQSRSAREQQEITRDEQQQLQPKHQCQQQQCHIEQQLTAPTQPAELTATDHWSTVQDSSLPSHRGTEAQDGISCAAASNECNADQQGTTAADSSGGENAACTVAGAAAVVIMAPLVCPAASPSGHDSSCTVQLAVTSATTMDSPDAAATTTPQGLPAAAVAGRKGVAPSLLNLLQAALPGSAAVSSMADDFSDLQQAAHELYGPTPRTFSISSDASSLWGGMAEPPRLHHGASAQAGRQLWSQPATASARAAAAAAACSNSRNAPSGNTGGAGMYRSMSLPMPGDAAASAAGHGVRAAQAARRSGSKGRAALSNRVQPV